MQIIDIHHSQAEAFVRRDGLTGEYSLPLSQSEQQVDVIYFDRPGEVHVNLALGRLCPVGCRECSATLLRRGRIAPLQGNLAPEIVERKVRGIADHLRPTLGGRSVVISAMNDGDPLTRSADEIIDVVAAIVRGCDAASVRLDRVNLSSSLIAYRQQTILELAQRYQAVFGPRLVQIQASLLATRVKQNIFAGDGSALAAIIAALGRYRERMRAAAGRGEVWVNYVAVGRGDYGRADGPTQLESVARVATTLARLDPAVRLKITRGNVDGLQGWRQLGDDEYEGFVAAVRQRWDGVLSIYAPDAAAGAPESHRCGRIQALGQC
jgi:hypothetical protein